VIIDDEPIALEKLESYVAKVPFLELAGRFQSAHEALPLINSGEVDALFTDINMPDLDGLSLIRELSSPPLVVFITAHAAHAVESYRLSAIDYLLKPYGFPDFLRAANKLARQYSLLHNATTQSDSDYLFVKTDSRYLRVAFADIRYIKGYGEYLQVFVEGEATPLVTLSSFASVRTRLPSGFMQVHRSYLVNLNRVTRVERMRIVMDDGTYIPVSESYKSAFLQYLHSRSVGNR